MSKSKSRGRSLKASPKKALRLWRNDEVKRINELISKLMPLLRETKHDDTRSLRYHKDLRLWRLRNRCLNPRDRQVYKRYIDVYGTLRYEPRHASYDPPLPVVVGASHVHPLQLRRWRKDLKKLLRVVQKR